MQILIDLLGALTVVYFVGFGVTGLAAKQLPLPIILFMPVVGYSLSQLLFFPAYFLLGSATHAVVLVMAVGFLLNLAYLWPCLRGRTSWRKQLTFDTARPPKSAYILTVLIVLVSAWPYLMAGWGKYWHSGNEDIMDALYGRDAYISGQLAEGNSASQYGGISRDVSWDAYLLARGVVSATELSAAHYIVDAGRLQYSSVAFWSVLLNAYHGMDAFLVQSLLNLLLMAYGVYLVGVASLGMSRRSAAFAAGAAVLSNFYLTTYVNGHEGSLLYNSVAPFLLYAVLKWVEDGKWRWSWVLLIGVLLLFLLNAYPYPLPYLALPLVAYTVHRLVMVRYGYWVCLKSFLQSSSHMGVQTWDKRKIVGISLLSLLLVVLIVAFSWQLFEPVRMRAGSQFRSWGTVFNYVGIFQYWGIWQSNLTNGQTYLPLALESNAIVALSAVLAASLTALSLYGFFRMAREGHLFFPIWLGIWLLLFLAMRIIVADSYYFYKFLYINSFVGVLALVYGYAALAKGRHKAMRHSASALVLVWLSANLANDGVADWSLANRLYNQNYAGYEEILKIKPEILAHTFIDIPRADHGDVLRQIISSHGLHVESDISRAQFLLRMDRMPDIATEFNPSQLVWESSLFRLVKAPDHNLLHVASYWEPELVDASSENPFRLPFRWASDQRIGGVSIAIERLDGRGKYLHFCAEPGPSLDYRPITLLLHDAGGKEIAQFPISGYTCHWLDLAASGKILSPLTLSSELVGRIISPVESRKLNYRISNIGVSPERFNKKVLASLASNPDITPEQTREYLFGQGSLKPDMLFLGNGWHNIEHYAGDNFRWVANDAEIIYFGEHAVPNLLSIDIEPGPSLGGKPLHLDIFDKDGVSLGTVTVSKRQSVNIVLPAGNQASVYRLHAESSNHSVPNDQRILNFRVFKISQLQSEAKP